MIPIEVRQAAVDVIRMIIPSGGAIFTKKVFCLEQSSEAGGKGLFLWLGRY